MMTSNQNVRVSLNLNVRTLKRSATLAINERSQALADQGKKIYRLGFGQSPFPVPSIVVKALQEYAFQKDYLPVMGLPALREAIANFHNKGYDLNCSKENILIGPGSKELLFNLQLAFYGDLLVPSPSWVSYAPQAFIVGKNVNWIPTKAENNWKLSAEDLEAVCKDDPAKPRVLILNYPSNPTGATLGAKDLEAIAQVAKKYNLIIIADEIYGELHHDGAHQTIASFYPEGTIISSGLSKWCGAGGWRLGFFIFPTELAWLQEAMAVVASETFTSTSAPVQHAAVVAFSESEEIDNYLYNARRILKVLGNTIHQKLKSANIQCPKPEGGFYLFPDFSVFQDRLAEKGIHSSVELCEALLNETGVALLPSPDFGRPLSELTARLSFVNFDGGAALEAARNMEVLDEQFLAKYCKESLEAIDLIAEWVKS